jgi:hypothetical protein
MPGFPSGSPHHRSEEAFAYISGGAGLGALIGGAASIGLMATTNFIIRSDFKWTLLGMAALWAASLVAFALERTRSS